MENFQRNFSNFFREQQLSSILWNLLAGYSAFKLLKTWLLSPLWGIWKHFIRPRRNLLKRYAAQQGAEQWAVVTGASYGIGEAITYELAKSGFNVVIIARTEENLQKVATNVQTNFKKKAVILPFDLQTLNTEAGIQAYFNQLEEVIGDKDISILVNNAGKLHSNLLHDHTLAIHLQILQTNINSYLFTSHFFLPHLKKRYQDSGSRSAIINISSFSAKFSIFSLVPYAATKAYVYSLSEGIRAENPHLDVFTVCPLSVSTNMYKGSAPGTIEASECAKVIFDQLGYEKVTIGHWKHELQNFMILMLPGGLRLVQNEAKKVYDQMQKEKATA